MIRYAQPCCAKDFSTADPMTKRHRGPRFFKVAFDAFAGRFATGLLRLARSFNRASTANICGAAMRTIGPWLPRHKIGQANLRKAFPEKSDAEIERILSDVWDNLGRVAAEFSQLDKTTFKFAHDPGQADVTYDPRAPQFIEQMRNEKSSLCFAAHLANWELLALIPPRNGFNSYILYRRPNLRALSDAILKIRGQCMGTLVPAGLDAPLILANALENGANVGILVDQQFRRGVDVTFFGRPCKANPLLAILARRFDCPVHGMRVSRKADRNTFQGEFTEPIALPRDAEGKIDVQGAMQTITSIVEKWVREDPGQWLWLHDRWR